MLARLFLLFTLVPLVELFLLLRIGEHVGFWPTVGLVLATGATGAILAKREGLRVLREYQAALAQLRMPEEGLTSALLVLVGGAMMIAPGVLTDLAGILLMVPPIRRAVARWLERYVERHVLSAQGSRVVYREVHVGPRGVVERTVMHEGNEVKRREDESRGASRPGEILEPDLVVDRRGRVVARLED